MRKAVWGGFSILLALLLAYCVHYFYRIAANEYHLYQADQLLTLHAAHSTSHEDVLPKRVQRQQLLAMLEQLKTAPVTAVAVERTYLTQARLSKALADVSVWPEKRRQYAQDALFNVYNALNINRYAMHSWMLGLQLQHELSTDEQQRFWSLANVLTLGRWNHDAMRYGSFYCVLYWKSLPDALRERCQITLQRLMVEQVERKKTIHQLRTISGYQAVLEQIAAQPLADQRLDMLLSSREAL